MDFGGGKKFVNIFLLAFVVFFGLIFSFGGVSAVTDCAVDPEGTYCGTCYQSGCFLVLDGRSDTLDYLIGGTKTCQDGVCSSSTCTYLSVCADPDIFDNAPQIEGISVSGCAAACDQDSDCTQIQEIEGTCYYNGGCNPGSCQCYYDSEETCAKDGWQETTITRWISTGDCTEKQQVREDYIQHSCDNTGCVYNPSESRWIDNGNTRPKPDETLCGLASQGDCDGQDTCQEGICVQNIFPLGTLCRPEILGGCDIAEYCDGQNYNCPANVVVNQGTPCEDGLFCTVEECNGLGECVFSKGYDCSGNSLNPFSTCRYNPDNNPFTFDVFTGFTSVCDEASASCTTYNEWDDLAHTCSVYDCQAECDSTHSCQDKCIDDTLYYNGGCTVGCTCSYSTENCNSYDDWYDTGSTQWVSDGECTEKEQKEQEYRDYYCDLDGCEFRKGNAQWIDAGATRNIPDITNPVTSKEYGNKFIDDQGFHYINSSTPITLTAKDDEECASGVNRVYWKHEWVSNEVCEAHPKVSASEVNPITPSTNEQNEVKGWAYFDVVNVDLGEATINFVSTRNFYSCFEVRTDGDTSQKTSDTNYNVEITDGLYPYYCVKNSNTQVTIPANEYIEIRMVFGAETDERFDWTRFDVLFDLSDWEYVEEDSATFSIPDESCHRIRYMSVDKSGNVEEIVEQYVMVDNQPPVTNKTVEEVKTKWLPNEAEDDFETSYFYPEETAHCWDGTEEEIECWKVTLDTEINMECYDPAPHPVGFEKLCFKVDWDAEDITSSYCEGTEGSINDEGYCCVNYNITGFKFYEESEHNLEYYCEDRLGNREYDEEKFKVFGRMEEIDLFKKWNLISVPFDPINKNPEAVFSDAKEDIDSVWSYNAEENKWYVYRPSAEESLTNNLEEIETGLGYWIMAKENTGFSIGGSLLSPGPGYMPSQKVVKGWNLIGYYGTEPSSNSVYCTLFSLVDTQEGFPRGSSLWRYDAYNQQFFPLSLVGSSMSTKNGYWLEMDVDDYYAPSTMCVQQSTLS